MPTVTIEKGHRMDYYRIVDSNEFEKRRMIMLERGWVQQRLHSGDYSWLSRNELKFGLTLKTTDDFLGSKGYRSDTFAKQLDEMLDTYDVVIFMREGGISFDPATGYVLNVKGDHNIKDIRNWLHRWQVKGIVTEQTFSIEQTANRICELYALWQERYSFSARSRKWADERMLAMPSGIRGSTGQKILDHFGSLRAIAVAGKSQLTAIPGVGEKKAELVLNHFGYDHRIVFDEAYKITKPAKPVDDKPLFGD